MKITHQVTTLVPGIKRMGESQGFSAGRFVIRRCDTELERICCPYCEMSCMGHLWGGTERELSASLCVVLPWGLSLEVQYVLCQQWVLYVWESGYASERVQPDPWPPRLSLSLRSWEIQGLLASPPHAPHKVTFRGTLFPPNPKHTTLFFPGRRPGKVGVHMRWILLSAHGTGDPTCEGTTQFIQPGPRPGNTLASVTPDQPAFIVCACYTHFTRPLTNSY